MYSNDIDSHGETTWYDNASAVWTEQPQACLSHPPTAAGGAHTPEQSPIGTMVEPKRSFNGQRAAWLPQSTALWSRLESGEVHDGFDEDGVVADVSVLGIKLGQRAEEWTSTGYVHLAHRSLEGGGGDVGTEGIDDVLPVALVQ